MDGLSALLGPETWFNVRTGNNRIVSFFASFLIDASMGYELVWMPPPLQSHKIVLAFKKGGQIRTANASGTSPKSVLHCLAQQVYPITAARELRFTLLGGPRMVCVKDFTNFHKTLRGQGRVHNYLPGPSWKWDTESHDLTLNWIKFSVNECLECLVVSHEYTQVAQRKVKNRGHLFVLLMSD